MLTRRNMYGRARMNRSGRKKNYPILIFLSLLCLAGAATAENQPKGFAVAGVGTSTCVQFSEHTKGRPDIMFAFISWSQGLMSGLNMEHIVGDTVSTDLSDHQYQEKWLRNFCGNNPEKSFYVAVLNLWKVLRDAQRLPAETRY